jgi:hypothetical protein
MLRTTRDGAAPLFGRTEEQGLLASLLDEVATRGQALVLRGEPGIGKSRLLHKRSDGRYGSRVSDEPNQPPYAAEVPPP